MSTLLLEVRKIRRKHYWLMAAGASVLLVLWSSGLAATRASRGPDSAKVAVMNLHEAFQLITLFGPVVVAILASRLVTVDTEARMGQMMTALGQHATTRFWGKLVVVGLTVVLAEGAVIGFAVVNASIAESAESPLKTWVTTTSAISGRAARSSIASSISVLKRKHPRS